MKKNIYAEIAERGVITEREVNLMKNRLNRGYNIYGIFDNGPLDITPEQTEKGLAWLKNLNRTPRGAIRKNNPFTKKQASVLSNFRKFQLIGFWDNGTWCHSWYIPIYRVWPNKGKHFDYIATYNNHKEPIRILS